MYYFLVNFYPFPFSLFLPSRTCINWILDILNNLNVSYLIFFFFFFSGPHPWHMEVPRLGVDLEPQLPAYTIAMATPDPSCICDLYHSSQQHRSLTL